MDIDTNPTYIFDIREMFLNYNYCRFLVSRLPADYPSLTTCLQGEHIKCVFAFLGNFRKEIPLQIPLLTAIGFWSNCPLLKCSNKSTILEYFHGETFEVALISETSQAFPNGRLAGTLDSSQMPPIPISLLRIVRDQVMAHNCKQI